MLVSVSVSVLDPPPSNSLLHKQFRLEAGVGIEPTTSAVRIERLKTRLFRF